MCQKRIEVLSASFGGVIKQQIKTRWCPTKLKIQLKILIALNTLVDRICLLILLFCAVLTVTPPSPANSLFLHSCSHALSCLLHFISVHQHCPVTPNRWIIALPSVRREMQVKRVMITTAFVGHGLGLGSESTFETYDALCMRTQYRTTSTPLRIN